jgi:hypothetical protein
MMNMSQAIETKYVAFAGDTIFLIFRAINLLTQGKTQEARQLLTTFSVGI